MAKLEIGYGKKKSERADFIGLDRFPLAGVDVVCNLDEEAIPFPANYFDLVYASHSLEHVRDLLAVMRNIWRVCKPGAQLCILAQYYAGSINFSNPYHLQAFNEHTPRFWTTCPDTGVSIDEYRDHTMWGQGWGLAQSDNSEGIMDFRCKRIEFFYYPEYQGFSRQRLIKLRRGRNNICHCLLYHLQIHKGAAGDDNDMALYDPPETVQLQGILQGGAVRHGRCAISLTICSETEKAGAHA